MPTYVYECAGCDRRFELLQSMKDAPIEKCPQCGGSASRVISGGMAVIVKGQKAGRPGCAFTQGGSTCCGADRPCGDFPCGQ